MKNLFDYVYGAFYPILQIDQNDTFKPNMQIRLFHLQNSRSQRIVWFLEELGLPYELVINHHSNVDEKKNSPHQLAKFPTLEMIDQGKISILVETNLSHS